jgi:hypothetical protein
VCAARCRSSQWGPKFGSRPARGVRAHRDGRPAGADVPTAGLPRAMSASGEARRPRWALAVPMGTGLGRLIMLAACRGAELHRMGAWPCPSRVLRTPYALALKPSGSVGPESCNGLRILCQSKRHCPRVRARGAPQRAHRPGSYDRDTAPDREDLDVSDGRDGATPRRHSGRRWRSFGGRDEIARPRFRSPAATAR